jgi:WD40-like Beta Propeller Repeat
MATQVPAKRNRGPWIIVGVLGCSALCLFFVLVAGGLYAVVSGTQPTPVARELPTMIAPATSMPLATTVARPSPVAGELPTVSTPATPMPLATTVARPSPIATPTTSRTGRIAYIASDPKGDPFKKDAIYLMNPDGSQRTLVTDKLSVSNNLLWSPDGTRMVFDARDDTNISVSGMYMANADGTGLNRLTICSQCMVNSPAWSPDGKRIAFQFDSIEPGKPYQGPKLYLMNPDGSQPTPLADKMGIIRQLA